MKFPHLFSIQKTAATLLFIITFLPTALCEPVPLFSEPDPQSNPAGLLDNSREYEVLEIKKDHILEKPAMNIPYSGIRYSRDCILVKQGGLKGWAIDGIFVKDNAIDKNFKINTSLIPYMMISGAALLIMTILLAGKLRRKPFSPRDFLDGPANIISLMTWLIAARIFLFFLFQYHAGKYSILFDGRGYFATGQMMFRTWDFTDCRYTIGNSLLHGIFSLLTGARDVNGIVFPLSYFNALLTAPLNIIMTYVLGILVFRKKEYAIIAAAACTFYPFIVQITHTMSVFPHDSLHIPSVYGKEYSLSLYYFSELAGYVTESDTFNILICLFAICSAIKTQDITEENRKTKYAWIFVCGLLFGFSGTVRVSDIFLLPLIAYVLFGRILRCKDRAGLTAILIESCVFGAGAIAGFAPQFAANYMQFGNILKLPYALHAAVGSGYAPSFFRQNLPFLLNGLSILFSLSAAGLCFIDKDKKIFFLLFIFPLFMFYSFYTVTCGDAIRFVFPLYPALFLLSAVAFRNCFRAVFLSLAILAFKPHFMINRYTDTSFIIVIFSIVVLSLLALTFRKKLNAPQWFAKESVSLVLILTVQALILLSNHIQR